MAVHALHARGVAGTVGKTYHFGMPLVRCDRFAILVQVLLVQLQFGERDAEQFLVEREGEPCLREVVSLDEVVKFGFGLLPLRKGILQLFNLFFKRGFEVVEDFFGRFIRFRDIIPYGRVGIVTTSTVRMGRRRCLPVRYKFEQFALFVYDLTTQEGAGILVADEARGDFSTHILRRVVHRLRAETGAKVRVELQTRCRVRLQVSKESHKVRQ